MTIYDQLMGAPGAGGRVVLLCKVCKAPAQDAKSTAILKVCSKCGTPLGEWATEAERDAELKEFGENVKRQGPPVMKMFKIRIKSGAHSGRYVGMRFGGGLVTNLDVQMNPPVNVPGAKYGLWAQESGGTNFFEHAVTETLAELQKVGYETELIQTQ
jgi:hypothetical protein